MLATTELPSGAPLDNGSGWARLDLYKAPDGYGARNGPVVVKQDAMLGGFNARDSFDNDITGTGSLVKQGTGELGLTGNNGFSGGVSVEGGRLAARSAMALGTGNLSVAGTLSIGETFAQGAQGTLEFDITGPGNYLLSIAGSAVLGGRLLLDFLDGLDANTPDLVSIIASDGLSGGFASIDVVGLTDAYAETLVRTATGLELRFTAIPEPAGWLVMIAGPGMLGLLRAGIRTVGRAAPGGS